MITPGVLYHGGPAGLSGTLLPKQVTGATGPGDILPRWPGATGALQDVLWGPDRVYLTSDVRTARYFAASIAVQHSRPFGTVYRAVPNGETEPDIDTPWSWAARSAEIVSVHDPVVRAASDPAMGRAMRRRIEHGGMEWLLHFTEDDRADAIDALNARARERGEAGRPWLDLMAELARCDFSGLDGKVGAIMDWAACCEQAVDPDDQVPESFRSLALATPFRCCAG